MKNVSALVVTSSSIYGLEDRAARAKPIAKGSGLSCIAAGQSVVVVAEEGGRVSILESDGLRPLPGKVEDRVDCLLVLREDPLEILAGTLDARVYRVTRDSVCRVETFDALSCREGWHTPWGGPPSVRSFAATPDGWVYADIHVGSIMRSDDEGRTWQPVTPDLNEDVHQVNTSPAAPDRVYANTARAAYVSDDRGESWSHRADDLDCRYGRAIAAAPDDPDLVLATVSDGPHGDNVHGQLWRSEDCGRNWTHVCGEFPASTRENINTYHVAFSPDGRAWALAGDVAYVGRDRATTWDEVARIPEEPLMLMALRSGH